MPEKKEVNVMFYGDNHYSRWRYVSTSVSAAPVSLKMEITL